MGGLVYFNLNDDEEPISLFGFDDSHAETYPFSTRWIPQEDRYFLIKCSQFPLGHRHEHHPSNGFLGLQVDIQWPYKLPDHLLMKVLEEFLLNTEIISDCPWQLPVEAISPMNNSWILAARPKTLVASVLPVFTGFILALEDTKNASFFVGFLCLLYCLLYRSQQTLRMIILILRKVQTLIEILDQIEW